MDLLVPTLDLLSVGGIAFDAAAESKRLPDDKLHHVRHGLVHEQRVHVAPREDSGITQVMERLEGGLGPYLFAGPAALVRVSKVVAREEDDLVLVAVACLLFKTTGKVIQSLVGYLSLPAMVVPGVNSDRVATSETARTHIAPPNLIAVSESVRLGR